MASADRISQLIRQYLGISRIVWFALVVGSIVYAYLAYHFSSGENANSDQGPAGLIVNVLSALAVVAAMASIVVKNWLLNRPGKSGISHVSSLSSEDQQAVQEAPEELRRFIEFYPRWLTAYIVALAFSEAVILFGLVLSMVTHRFSDFVPFWVGGLLLLVWHIPRAKIKGQGRRG